MHKKEKYKGNLSLCGILVYIERKVNRKENVEGNQSLSKKFVDIEVEMQTVK